MIWRLSERPLQNLNLQNELVLDAVMVVLESFDKLGRAGSLFTWGNALVKANFSSKSVGRFFFRVRKCISIYFIFGFGLGSLVLTICI